LTRVYFENAFCLLPFSASSSSKSVPADQRSEIGVKIALGDSGICILIIHIRLSNSAYLDGPETTEIVIFAQLKCTAESSNSVQLSVARLTPRPPAQQVQKRVPRPDDPTPRKPPAFYLQGLKRAGSLGASVGELKRVAALGSGVRLGAANAEGDRVFKVPEVPRSMKGDVFGDIAEISRVNCAESKSGKGKQKSEEGPMVNELSFEKANKNVSVSLLFSWVPT
jgi:hypothetical protein